MTDDRPTHRCEHCGDDLSQYLPYLSIERIDAAHRIPCPTRPIEVGDYVRWESGTTIGRWVEGELMDLPGQDRYGIRVIRKADFEPRFPDARGWHLFNTLRGGTICRIPRPAEAQATARHGACCAHPLERHAYNGCADCGCCIRWSEHPDRDLDKSDSAQIARMHSTGLPAPVFVDGLTPAQCLAEYSLRQKGIDRQYRLTPAQLATAREEWSAALHAKRDASDEAERCRVTYCEVEPWE